MELLDWGYTRRYNIKAYFSKFPNSLVIFRQITDYYFVYQVKWSDLDPVVNREDLEEMELLINQVLGMEEAYLKRKSKV
ncbi:hypothetical protein [Bacillus sp. FJAT-47783]|uniref:hypothetical protein n=1 Tax=Bacillus sp. FJAT-47783 TaxID=2922712 RepID=UPI001FADE174|nr:hypothetical protein [Bacillus sp. FJAT-47783]